MSTEERLNGGHGIPARGAPAESQMIPEKRVDNQKKKRIYNCKQTKISYCNLILHVHIYFTLI